MPFTLFLVVATLSNLAHGWDLEPPVDCSWGEWSEYSTCSVTCGGAGTQTRTRSKAVEASGGGFDCVGPTEETTSCNNGECSGKY